MAPRTMSIKEWWSTLATHLRDKVPLQQQILTAQELSVNLSKHRPVSGECKCLVAVRLLRLTYFKEHKALAITALQAHVHDQLDELATLERAKRACAAVAHKSGVKVCAGFVLPSNFKPSEKEVQALLKVAKMPIMPTWSTEPATTPAPPDRNPRVGFPLRSAAELSAGNGAFMRYVEKLGVPVKWYAEQ